MKNSFVELNGRQRAFALVDENSGRELVGPEYDMISPHLEPQKIVPESDDGVILVKGTLNGKNVAEAAQKISATMVYISTDYVFDGTNEDEYQVDAPTNPKNEYGKAKLAGEEAVKSIMDQYYIIRTSWVFGEYGKNFVYTMLHLAKTHDYLTVVDDQVGRPTWTRTLAEFMLYAIEHQIPYGTYQLSNDGSCTWYEFAREILKNEKVEVSPVTSAEYPQKAYRPRHSIMSLDKVKETGFEVPTWQEALEKFMDEV